MATYTRYVDPASSAGGNGTEQVLTGATRAYVSANAWEAAEQAAHGATDTDIVICSSNLDAGGGPADTTALTISGWTDKTGGNYIGIQAASSHGGEWNDNIYRLQAAPSGEGVIKIVEGDVVIIRIQIDVNPTGVIVSHGINYDISIGANAASLVIQKAIIKYSGSTTGNCRGIRVPAGATMGASSVLNIYNSLVYDFVSGTSNGLNTDHANLTTNVFNCTVHNCDVGYIRPSAGTFNATNCGAAACTTGFSGTITQTTCSSSTPTFVDEAGDDFHLASNDTTWTGQGTDLSGTFTDDIDGETRPTGAGTWDIGADEYVAAGGGAYTLICSGGSLSLTGQAMSPKAGRKLTAAQGAYVLTGAAAALRADRKLSAAQGTHVLSGQSVALLAGRKLTAAQGAYILTGGAASLFAARLIQPAQGALSLSGQAAGLIASRLLAAAAGSLSLTGQDAALKASRTLSGATGLFSLSGRDVGLIYSPGAGYSLVCASGTYALTGQEASLLAGRALAAGGGAYVLTGKSAGMLYISITDPAIVQTLPRLRQIYALPGVNQIPVFPRLRQKYAI